MESRFRNLLLMMPLALPVLVTTPAAAAEEAAIEPQIERRSVSVADIDTEDFEAGIYAGMISVEDFGVNSVAGLRLAYHVNEWLFVEGAYGRSKAGKSSYERLSGAAYVLTEPQRDYSYYNLALGINLFPGESFLAGRYTFNTDFYLIGGVGTTEFAGDKHFTINGGGGYRVVLNDWAALHFDMRDHIFDVELLGEKRSTHNIEFNVGATVFF